ncbi:skp1-like protein 14 [Phtheirospermum japonicum]|uniref:SKP1-like protein n=1 Tax=Phtheirospermum japonicum TaxID=374723 RepID=A0A830B6A2_9LAMI|nr:skp1-like protein 14 [Phtheirospermum japonicum]
MLKDMPAEETEIPLQDVDGETLHNVVTYLNAHAAAGDNENEKKRFDGEFLPGKPEMGVLFDVVLAANNLKIEGLMDLVSGKIADRIKNKSVEWVRREFDFENDLTAEEVSEMMDQTPWAFEGVDPDEEQLVD